MRNFRPTVRFRLTVLYGSLFLTAGAVLLVVNYTLVSRSMPDSVEDHRSPFVEEIRVIVEEHQGSLDQPSFSAETFEIGADQADGGRSVPDVFADFESNVQTETLDQLVRQSIIALGLTGGIAVVLGWLTAGRVLQPVHRITATARSASQTNLRTRVDLDGPPDELKELADTFDQMLARLESAFESQRRFAAQASHELRTPISVIRAEADVALAADRPSDSERVLADSVRVQADRSEALIDGLLTLARSESRLHESEPVDLAALAGNVVGESVGLANEHGVEIDLSLDEAMVSGDRVLLERMISNLVANAIIHSEVLGSGSRWMRLAVGTDGPEAVLSISNSGPVLNDDEVSPFFEPFQRRNGHNGQDRRGVGLGLTIVRAVAATHGGSISLQPLPEGGIDVAVRLPSAG